LISFGTLATVYDIFSSDEFPVLYGLYFGFQCLTLIFVIRDIW